MDMDPADAIRYAKYHISLSNVSVFTLPQMTGEVTGELIKPMHFSIEAAVLQDPDSVMDLISESDREKYPKVSAVPDTLLLGKEKTVSHSSWHFRTHFDRS